MHLYLRFIHICFPIAARSPELAAALAQPLALPSQGLDAAALGLDPLAEPPKLVVDEEKGKKPKKEPKSKAKSKKSEPVPSTSPPAAVLPEPQVKQTGRNSTFQSPPVQPA